MQWLISLFFARGINGVVVDDGDSDHPSVEVSACEVNECGPMRWNCGMGVGAVFLLTYFAGHGSRLMV